MRRVVVTGLGLVSPVGNTVKESWTNCLEGRSGVRRITQFDPSALSVQIAAEVKNLNVGERQALDLKELPRTSRFCQFAAVAAQEAIKDADLKYESESTDTWGTSIGVGLGALQDIEEAHTVLVEQGPKRVSPFFLPYVIPNMAAGIVSKYYNLKGPNICTTTACSSGTHGVGEGWLYIRNGLADVMVCGGAEAAISPLGVTSFANMKALARDNDAPESASKPFDLNRSGFVMGEGCGLLVLEELEHALRRGAHIYAEMVGYGMSGDAYHITAPAPEGEGGQRSMRMALSSGNIPLAEVDHINAHGTSTKMNDHFETLAIKHVFGEALARKIAICSTKGVTGHCLGAAGGIEAVFMALTVHNSIVPPTANYTTPDPECDLDYTVGSAREIPVRFALSNSFGFGGTNATIAMKRFTGS